MSFFKEQGYHFCYKYFKTIVIVNKHQNMNDFSI